MGAGKLLKLTVKVVQIFVENDAKNVSLCLLLAFLIVVTSV